MKKMGMFFVVIMFCACVSVARAQGGGVGSGPCDSSPENPTIILMALGSAGAGLAALRTRLSARKAKK